MSDNVIYLRGPRFKGPAEETFIEIYADALDDAYWNLREDGYVEVLIAARAPDGEIDVIFTEDIDNGLRLLDESKIKIFEEE